MEVLLNFLHKLWLPDVEPTCQWRAHVQWDESGPGQTPQNTALTLLTLLLIGFRCFFLVINPKLCVLFPVSFSKHLFLFLKDTAGKGQEKS